MDIWVSSTSWLFWTVLLWKWVCRYFSESLLWILWGYILRSGIAGSYGSSILNLGGSSILFFVAFTVLHSHQQCTRVTISLVYYFERRGSHGWLVPPAIDIVGGMTHMWGVKLLTYTRVPSSTTGRDPTSCRLKSKSQLHSQPHAESGKREHI